MLTYWFFDTGHQLLVNVDWMQQYISLHEHTSVAIMVCTGTHTHTFPFSPLQEAAEGSRTVWRSSSVSQQLLVLWCKIFSCTVRVRIICSLPSPSPCRSLLERLVGARLVYQQATMTRVISFEYLNRQLVWQVGVKL